ncbi:PREDICTED: pentatricopeptide repeat-containing protein 2, mitochondrial-like [Priapulus caudatus]|uniref:Pentatricopeptide repeat-containing protein 2, mitochondrial-like n=1 Tax=Priapulus caudatus TaxID=37621 RepID=A0ABM1DSK3_PRICU|nr:PREDICTED: pentatricopeptide repeat-containing protein 2, mitochondrial-like [Priapulus caudatus]
MDLLYKHELYQEVLDTYQLLRGRELERARYPRDCIILCLAACYRMDTPAAYEWATALARECGETGRPMPRRAIAFLAMLALNRGDPAAALEVLFTLREVNYITTRNLKLIALADLDRVDEALPVLRYVIERDVPETATRRGQEVCATTLARVRAAVERAQREELTAQFSHLERALAEGDHVAKVDIAEIVTTPILERRPPPQQRQDYQPSGAYNQRYRSQARGQGYYDRQQHDRPGLSDRYDT